MCAAGPAGPAGALAATAAGATATLNSIPAAALPIIIAAAGQISKSSSCCVWSASPCMELICRR
jgi:hypothetical protein